MVELSGSLSLGTPTNLNFGGDVLNTALYFARLGGTVSFFTALGDDPLSEQMSANWQGENIITEDIAYLPNRMPGLYAIKTDENGERSFYYWRDEAPIKQLFQHVPKEKLNALSKNYNTIYLSGISLSRWDQFQLKILENWLVEFRQLNELNQVIFDLNYRPRCWKTEQAAKEAIEKVLPHITTVITTYDDEVLLYEDSDYQQTIKRYQHVGVRNIIIKRGAEPTILVNDSLVNDSSIDEIPHVIHIEKPTDTTAAGDSFNAALLAAQNLGLSPKDSCRFAQQFAAEVIQHKGAIIPKQYTQKYSDLLLEK
jgi:2-dehydro-3-deoxygluconokinase